MVGEFTTQVVETYYCEPTLTFISRHKIVIAGNHEITFDKKSFDNPWAKKKVFGENYNPADLEVGDSVDKLGYDCSKVSQFPNFASLLTNCTYLENSSIEVSLYSMNILEKSTDLASMFR